MYVIQEFISCSHSVYESNGVLRKAKLKSCMNLKTMQKNFLFHFY